MRNLHKSLSIILICTLLPFCYSQNINITYENPSGIEICGNQEVYRVTIENNSNKVIDEHSLLEVNLPIGIVYVDNTVSNNFTDVTVIDLNNPIFKVLNVIAIGDSLSLEFQAIAKCNSYLFINDDLVDIKNIVKYSYYTEGEEQPEIILDNMDNYNLSFRNISLELPIESFGVPNQTLEFTNTTEILTQELNISIPGNSIDFSEFQINVNRTEELALVGVSELIIGTTSYDVSGLTVYCPISTPNTSTIVFNASNIGLSVSDFSANMLIKVKFNFRAKSCFQFNTQHAEYESVIDDANTEDCVVSKIMGDFQFSSLIPNLTYTFDSDDALNLNGGTSRVTYVMTNPSSSTVPALDIHLFLKYAYGGQVSNIIINNISVDETIYSSSYGSYIHLLGNNITGLTALTDEDNDGQIDDLAPGASISVSCDVSLSLLQENFSLDNCDSGLYKKYFQAEFKSLGSECSTDYSLDNGLHSFFQFRDVSVDESIEIDSDIDVGDQNTVQFNFIRFGGGLNNQLYEDDMLLEANFEIPCGLGLVPGSIKFNRWDTNLELSTTETISVIDGKTILNIQLTEPYIFQNTFEKYGGTFEFDLILDGNSSSMCISNDPFLKATVYGAFSESPNQKLNLGCDEKELYLHYYPLFPSCPNDYPIVPSSFNAIRTSYGNYTDGTSITIEGIENGSFQGINSKAAYACDTIRTEIVSAAVCDLSSDQTFYGYIWYNHPENTPFFSMTQAEYTIGSGPSITTNNISLRTDLSTSIKTVYEIQISGQEVNKYDAVKINGFFTVDKMINNNPNFPNVYDVLGFRGGINIIPVLPLSPYHYGTEFEIYSLNYIGNSTSIPASCSNNGLYSMSFNINGGNGDDFPNEFRNIVQIVGPVELTIPEEVAGKIVPQTANYFVSNSFSYSLIIDDVGGGVYRIYDSNFGSLDEFRPFDKTRTSMKCSIDVYFALNDCELQGVYTVDGIASYKEGGYSTNSCEEILSHNYAQQIISSGNSFNTGDLSLDIVNPYFQTLGAITRYKIDVDNISDQQALYPWIKFNYPDDLITIMNSSISGYNILDSVYGDDTLLLKLQPIGANSSMEGYIDVLLNDCEFEEQNIDINIETGVSCGPISDGILNNDGTICALDTDKKVELEIIKSNLRMDVIALFDTNTPLQFCDTFQYVVQIFNNEKATIDNPNFKVDIPNGFEMSVQYRYPVYEAIDPTNPEFSDIGFSLPINIVSEQIWDLEAVNGVLPGYLANQNNYLNNYYQLLVTFTPTCTNDGTNSISFTATGDTNCTETKEIFFQSTPTFIELEQLNNYTPQLSIDVQQNEDLNNYSATVHYQPDTNIPESTGIVTISLPDGIYSTDNLSFELPQTEITNFAFNFTTAMEYCEVTNFLVDTIIETDMSCNVNTSCIKTFDFQERLVKNICSQECDIEAKFEIEKITDCTYQFSNHSTINKWGAVEYLWDFGDGNISTEFEPSYSYTVSGVNYVTLTITALNAIGESCQSTFGPIKIETKECFQEGGCTDIIATTSLKLFPNPNNGKFTLFFKNCIKYCEIQVLDMLGKIVYHKLMVNNNEVIIDVSNCAKGAYMIRASNDKMSITKRIVIK